jgi:tetratricopeptide (TPR) repeat protein
MKSPDSVVVAEARYRAGDYAAAAALLTAERAAAPDDPIILRLLGLCRLRLGDGGDALRLLRQALDRAPCDPIAMLHYGIGLQAAGRHEEAADLFRACQPALPSDPAPWLNLATSLLALGDALGALRAARKARLRAPLMAETHYTVGLAYLAAADPISADAAFIEATRRSPDFAEAWVNLGLIRYRGDNLRGAMACMRKALAIDPRHRIATVNLAVFLRLIGDAEQSEMLLGALLARDPAAAAARVNLADAMAQDGRPADALELLDHEMPPSRALREHWQLLRALCLLNLGRIAAARTALDSLGDVEPAARSLLQWRRVRLAVADGASQQARELAEEMEATIAGAEPILPEHRIMGYFDLARFWDGQGDTGRAFQCWRNGHGLLARAQPFDRARFAAFVDASIAGFDARRIGKGARASNRDQRPVFIVGMPRSGTTLTEQILAAHRDVAAAGERAALWEMFGKLGGGGDGPAAIAQIVELSRQQFNLAAKDYLAELRAPTPRAKRIVDKMPSNFCYIGLVALMLPRARIIYCERDPRDTGLSIFTHRFYGAHPYAHDLANLGWYIAQQRRLMAHWQAVLPASIMTVRLTDWVDDFSGTLRLVLAFLDLPYDPSCERFYESDRKIRTASRAQVREPINARGIGRWRRYADHLGPLFDALQQEGLLAT